MSFEYITLNVEGLPETLQLMGYEPATHNSHVFHYIFIEGLTDWDGIKYFLYSGTNHPAYAELTQVTLQEFIEHAQLYRGKAYVN